MPDGCHCWRNRTRPGRISAGGIKKNTGIFRRNRQQRKRADFISAIRSFLQISPRSMRDLRRDLRSRAVRDLFISVGFFAVTFVTILLLFLAHYLQSHIVHLVHHPYSTHFNPKLVCFDSDQSALINALFSHARNQVYNPSFFVQIWKVWRGWQWTGAAAYAAAAASFRWLWHTRALPLSNNLYTFLHFISNRQLLPSNPISPLQRVTFSFCS